MHLARCTSILLSLSWILLSASTAKAQSTLTGKLTDKQTGEPVPHANIFFGHTLLGTSSLEDGTFVIYRIPNGKYDLVVQVVGYHSHKQPLEFEDGQYRIEITMVQDTTLLDAVTVIADPSDKKYFPTFFQFFVGDDTNARECKIVNQETLHFYFDKQKNYLTVHARNPIQLTNPALGLKVHYSLERFELDFTTGVKIMQGNPRFEELPIRNRKDSLTRVKKRNRAYRGSLFHFMRALYTDALDKERFNLAIADSSVAPGSKGRQEILLPLKLEDCLTGDKVKQLQYKGLLKMEYRDNEDWEYPARGHSMFSGNNPKGFQQTYMQFKDPSIYIYENGYFSDQRNVYMTGYLVWKETVCNMVPLGHEMKVKKKKKKKEKRK